MEYFAKFCIAVMIILTAIFCVYLFVKIKNKIQTEILLRQKNRTVDLPYNLLKTNLAKRSIMRRVYLPFTEEPDSNIYYIDLITVNRGGVLLITVKNLKGTIENPFKGDWRQFYNDNITQFRNPLENGSYHARSLAALMKKYKLVNIPIKYAVCYIDNKTRFKNRIEQIIAVDKLIPYIKDMSKNRFLSNKEIFRTISVIQNMRKSIRTNKNFIAKKSRTDTRGRK
ncbi:MAG: nuclease-related domain-containing protein [Eubacteriales bacterium]|nr:nuclease-related domain-containing protein [Eubacteriales bacterium]